MLLGRSGEHVCPIRCVLVICLDEERLERGSNGGQAFVIPDEEATRKGCIQHVEGGRGDTHRGAKVVGRRREPVICW